MRAHFASDIPASPDTEDVLQQQDTSNATKESQPNMTAIESHSLLQDRIIEFRSDSSKMAVVGEFVEDVLKKAQEEANKQQNDKTKNSQQVCFIILQLIDLKKFLNILSKCFINFQGKNKTQKQSKFIIYMQPIFILRKFKN